MMHRGMIEAMQPMIVLKSRLLSVMAFDIVSDGKEFTRIRYHPTPEQLALLEKIDDLMDEVTKQAAQPFPQQSGRWAGIFAAAGGVEVHVPSSLSLPCQ